jgi:hypothetical protein
MMSSSKGASVPDQALAVPAPANAVDGPTGFNPSRNESAMSADLSGRSVAGRLNRDFKVVCSCSGSTTRLQLSGPIETQDELDAVVQALNVMREWLPEEAAEAEAIQ